jgi:hypothetical protein
MNTTGRQSQVTGDKMPVPASAGDAFTPPVRSAAVRSRVRRVNDTRDNADTVGGATVTVSRRAAGDIGHREVFASLDGQEFAILRYGDAITREVHPGHHRLRIHNTMFWKTIDLELVAGVHAEFSTLNRAGWGTYAIATFLGAGPVYLDISRIG